MGEDGCCFGLELTRDQEDIFWVAGKLKEAGYTFASTMPAAPHFYTARHWWGAGTDEEFTRTAEIVQRNGKVSVYGGHKYRQLSINSHYYWTMGAPAVKTIIINRKRQFYDSPYDEVADRYDTEYPERNEEVADLVLDAVGDISSSRVLDIGCGTGWLVDTSEIDPALYRGIDTSLQMLKRFTAKHPEFEDRLMYCSARDLYEPIRYDVLVALFSVGDMLTSEDMTKLCSMADAGGRFHVMLQEKPKRKNSFGFTLPGSDIGILLERLAKEGRVDRRESGQYRLFSGSA